MQSAHPAAGIHLQLALFRLSRMSVCTRIRVIIDNSVGFVRYLRDSRHGSRILEKSVAKSAEMSDIKRNTDKRTLLLMIQLFGISRSPHLIP